VTLEQRVKENLDNHFSDPEGGEYLIGYSIMDICFDLVAYAADLEDEQPADLEPYVRSYFRARGDMRA
jgi:hypothetical protein